jgi:polysaccharide export outer membrane protein
MRLYQPTFVVSLPRRLSRFVRLLRQIVVVGAVVSSPALTAGAEDHSYRLMLGDRISIVVFGQAELSGDLFVDGSGNIELPFVGTVQVKDLTLPDCQKAIAERITADGILAHPSVHVRINELRPLYILGDVRLPGTYPFRYGSTVQSALALAGGFRPGELIPGVAEYDFLAADERFRQLSSQRSALLVRRARLQAQRDDVKEFSPAAIPDVANDADIADWIASEKETFNSQAEIRTAQVNLMKSQRPRLQNEIEAVNGQIAFERKQVQIIQHQSDDYDGLLKKGLGLARENMQLKLDEASRESDIWRLSAELSRLQMDVGELDIKVQEVEASFKRQVVSDLQDVRQRLKDLDVTLSSSQDMREIKRRQVEMASGDDGPHSIIITRARSDGGATVIKAEGNLALEPGDIVDFQSSIVQDPRRRKVADNPSGSINPVSTNAP